ncbi:MAG: hypothetical protein R3F38_03775 [Gammaproteobacteria bacterium]
MGLLLDARRDEPYFTGTAQVRVENGLWRMWYQSCTGWVRQGDRIEPLITSNMQNQTMVLIGGAKAVSPSITLLPPTKAVSAARPFTAAQMVLNGIATAMPLITVTTLPTVIESAMRCRMTAFAGTVLTKRQVSMYQPRVGIAS